LIATASAFQIPVCVLSYSFTITLTMGGNGLSIAPVQLAMLTQQTDPHFSQVVNASNARTQFY